MMKIKWRIFTVLICVSMLLGACASSGSAQAKEDTGSTEKEESREKEYQGKLDAISPAAYGNAEGINLEKKSYISIIGKSEEGQFWEEIQKGVAQAAEDLNAELGYEGKDAVKVTYSAPATADNVDEQVNILDEELARYPVALGISIVDSQACEVQFDLAAESDIPIVAFDSGSDYQGLMATVSTDNRASAAEAADRLAQAIDGKGEILVFAHDSKSKTAKERESGFLEKIQAEYPEITVVNNCHLDEIEELKKTVAAKKQITEESVTDEDVTDYILEEYPNLKGCYATNGDAVKLLTAGLERQEMTQVCVVGYDADKDELEALKDGKLEGLMVQNPFGMGYASVIAAARAALDMGNEAYINTGYTWVTKKNMENAEVKKMLYQE